jgi:hypothetical protein
MTRPRSTLRRLMAIVAIAAIFSGSVRLWQRSVSFHALARSHGMEERSCLLKYQAEEKFYRKRCKTLIERGVKLTQEEIEQGLAEARALWPSVRDILRAEQDETFPHRTIVIEICPCWQEC